MIEWIKLEIGTPDKPEIIAMAAMLRIDQDAVLGKLFRVWAWASLNTEDGAALPITEAFLDRLTSQRRFAQALRSVGWLSGSDGALTFSNFGRHNGTTAKSRAIQTRKKMLQRDRKTGANCPPPTGQTGGQDGGQDGGQTGGQTGGQEGGPEEEEEEDKNSNNTASGSSVPPASAEPSPEAGGREASRSMPPHLDTPRFRESWTAWILHWSQSHAAGRAMPNATADAHLRKLAASDEPAAITAIENAIARGFREPAAPFAASTRAGNQRRASFA